MSKSNKCPIDSSSSNERNFRITNIAATANNHPYYHDKSNSPLSHISKYLDVSDVKPRSSKENVELALEVEIDESLKHVLTNAERDSSDLLDVTIIRPSDSDTTHETTVALYKDEVRDFITLVEQHHKNQISEKSKERKKDGETTEAGKNKKKFKTDYSCIEEIPDYKAKAEEFPKKEENQVYATVNTFDKLKHKLACQNSDRESDKPGTPCLCQHCGIVGVLVQSQKGPIAPFPPIEDNVSQQPKSIKQRDPSPQRKERMRRITGEGKRRPLDQIELLREINARIKMLEKRIALQEETAVPREYLKQILHKVLTQYNVKTTTHPETKLKNNATQYSGKNINIDDKNKETKNKSYQVHTVLDQQKWMDFKEEAKNDKRDLYWFWGDEIVHPGCDLKNKILKLLEDLKEPKDKQNVNLDVSKIEKLQHYFTTKEKATCGEFVEQGIKVEHDEKTIFLNVEQQDYRPRSRSPPQEYRQNPEYRREYRPRSRSPSKVVKSPSPPPTPPPSLPPKTYNINKPNYPFDVKKTIDDSTFKKNIESQKERSKPPPSLEEKYYNAYASQSITTESKASMEYIIQKLKNTRKFVESGLGREKQDEIDAQYRINSHLIPGSMIKENVNRTGVFRVKKQQDNSRPGSVDVKFVNPKIRQWSEESTTSEDKIMRQKAKIIAERKEPVALEKKESLIYKLDFLKNLARNKSIDQSRVLNKIWNQAKNTAKSKKDAVYIKIPFKNVNACEAQDNLIEMHLTLEELETVVKSTRRRSKSPVESVKVQSYKSTSEIDFGQRRHEELRYANKELLKSRQMSAKSRQYRR